jgi:hypothetical protein
LPVRRGFIGALLIFLVETHLNLPKHAQVIAHKIREPNAFRDQLKELSNLQAQRMGHIFLSYLLRQSTLLISPAVFCDPLKELMLPLVY